MKKSKRNKQVAPQNEKDNRLKELEEMEREIMQLEENIKKQNDTPNVSKLEQEVDEILGPEKRLFEI